MIRNLQTLWHPERFQGWGKRRNYFEGWYYKMVSRDERTAVAVIPGVAMDKQGEGHSFIQVLDGRKKTSAYHKFPLDDFKAESSRFAAHVGTNRFTLGQISVDVPGFSCDVKSTGHVPWPVTLFSPGIMGPYAFAPFMECYHGIVSMDHMLTGTLDLGDGQVDMSGGRGYIEKDWGRSFPSGYVWMQSNHFEMKGISMKASVANIPWLTDSFVGFIAGFWYKGEIIRFTTYNSSRMKRHIISPHSVELVLQNPRYELHITADRDEATELASPILGAMAGKIEESMTAVLNVRLYDIKTGKVLYKGAGRNAGLEVAGKVEELQVE